MQLIKTDTYDMVRCDFYTDSGEYYMTREQIGAALEYDNPQKAIDNLHGRHKERLDNFSVTLNLRATDGKYYDTIVYSRKGIMEICRWSQQPKADAFMDWVWDIMDGLMTGQIKAIKPKSPRALQLEAEKAESRAARDAVIQEQKDRMARRREFDKIYPHTYSLLWSVCVADRDLIDKVVKRYAKKSNRHILDRFDENSDYQYTDQGIREITEAVWEEQGNGSKIKDLLQSKWYLMKSEKPILKKIWEEEQRGQDA